MTTFNFTLVSNQDTTPTPTLLNGWQATFYPITPDSFAALNVHLDQYGNFLTQTNGRDGSTGDFYELHGQFNNFGGFPVSYVVDFDRGVGPSTSESDGKTFYGKQRNSTLIFGNTSGFIKGTYPSSFQMTTGGASPYGISINGGAQSYTKSDAQFTIAYGIYSCAGKWSITSQRSVCSLPAKYRYSFNNTGTLVVVGTKTQTLQPYTNLGYCASNDGSGTVTTFTDTSGTITLSSQAMGSDAAALAFVVEKFGGPLPAGAQGFMKVNVSQNYSDKLNVTSAFDGVFDWTTLPQQEEPRSANFAGLYVSSPMGTQALYTITTS